MRVCVRGWCRKRFCLSISTVSINWIVRADTQADFEVNNSEIPTLGSLFFFHGHATLACTSEKRTARLLTWFSFFHKRWLIDIKKATEAAHVKVNVTVTPSSRIPADVPPSPNVSAVTMSGALESSISSSATSKSTSRPGGAEPPNGREKKVQEPGKTEASSKRSGSGKDQTVHVTDLYSLGRVIDGGANGQVLEGLDKRNGERVAIKRITIGGGSNENEGQMEIWAQVVHMNVCVYR